MLPSLRLVLRRGFIVCVVIFQAPLAHFTAPALEPTAAAREPIAPIQVLARALVEAGSTAAAPVANATIAEHLMALVVLPGVLVRKPIPKWNITEDLRGGIGLSTRRTRWWSEVQQRELLLLGSGACCAGGPMMLFSAKRYAVLIFDGLFLAGLLLCGVVFAANACAPTVQFGMALVASAVELRGAWIHRPPAGQAAGQAAETKAKKKD